MSGRLYLLPSPIAENTLEAFSPQLIDLYKKLRFFAVEHIRTTRRWLKQLDRDILIDELTFFEMNPRTNTDTYLSILAILNQGNDIGVVSEAGCPGIADPGSELVSLAHDHEIPVIPIAGPSAILMALMASGFNGQSFTFHGYLPIKKNELNKKLGAISKSLQVTNYTQIFMEAPYRNNTLFNSLLSQIPKTLKLSVACEIGGINAFIKTQTIAEWKAQPPPDLHKRPTVFLLGK